MVVERRPEQQSQFQNPIIEEYISGQNMKVRFSVSRLDTLNRDYSRIEALSNFAPKAVEWGDSIIIVEQHPQLEVFDHPIKSESADSQAVYFARSRFKSPGILLQGLLAGDITTDHRHFEHWEKFKKGSGEIQVHMEDENYKRIATINDELVVPPGTYHQLRGIASRSVNLIVTSGSEDCLDKADHNYRPGNRFLT